MHRQDVQYCLDTERAYARISNGGDGILWFGILVRSNLIALIRDVEMFRCEFNEVVVHCE